MIRQSYDDLYGADVEPDSTYFYPGGSAIESLLQILFASRFATSNVPGYRLGMTGLRVFPKRVLLAFPSDHTTVAPQAPE